MLPASAYRVRPYSHTYAQVPTASSAAPQGSPSTNAAHQAGTLAGAHQYQPALASCASAAHGLP